MLGHSLFTKQTGPQGRVCSRVFLVERVYVRREYYFAIVQDRSTKGPCIIASSQGGMDIETVAHETPELIIKHKVDIDEGLSYKDAESVAGRIGLEGEAKKKV